MKNFVSSMKDYLITTLRDKSTGLVEFRRATHKMASILAAEAAAMIKYESVTVTTPLAETAGVKYRRRLVLAPVLRAGIVLLPTFLSIFDDALVGMIGIQRDEATAIGHGYYTKIPKMSSEHDVMVLDPMIATGGSGSLTVNAVKSAGAHEENIIYVSVIAAPEGMNVLQTNFPKMRILTAQIDKGLNDQKFILPGLGDFGDRFYGTL